MLCKHKHSGCIIEHSVCGMNLIPVGPAQPYGVFTALGEAVMEYAGIDIWCALLGGGVERADNEDQEAAG